jgi:diguanylate cyclase (GGDEF)-like protein
MVAALLADAVSGLGEQSAFAARLGGEEFLLVLCGRGHAEALVVLERLRRRVADHPWRQATGDLPVTISIGAAGVAPDSTQSTLLARADAQLYEAKRAGRNRVRTAGQPAGAIR